MFHRPVRQRNERAARARSGARARALLLAASLVALGLAAPARAVEVTWFAGNGVWNVPTNWYPFQLPSNGDLAWVKAPNGTQLTVTYQNFLDPTLGTFNVDTQGNGVLTFLHAQDSLRANVQNVGLDGDFATYRLSGGSNTILNDLNVAFWGTANGRYEISGTGQLTTGDSFVGVGGNGVMVQSGGSHVTSLLSIGVFGTSTSRYELSGTGFLQTATQLVGAGGDSRFIQSGGTNSVGGTLTVAQLGTSLSRYDLSAGSVNAGALTVGQAGDATFVQTGGSVATAGNMAVAHDGTSLSSYTLADGTLSVHEQKVGVWGDGSFFQTGGSHDVRSRLIVGDAGTSVSRFELSGGDLTSGLTDAGIWGNGVLAQSGGSWLVEGLLRLGFWGAAWGTLQLSGSADFEADALEVGVFGTGRVFQSGGYARVHDQVHLGVFANSTGLYRLTGGTLDTPLVDVEPDGTLEYTGGILAADRVDVLGRFDLSGAGTRQVLGQVVNNGRVEVDGTHVVYSGVFTNSQVYVSEGASTSEFFHFGVGPQGWISGDAGSRFVVTVSMQATSTRAALWDTTEAELVLDGPGGHIVRQPGRNLGPTAAGYVDNFAWGKLTLAAGDPVTLQDGDGVPGGALYVGILDLQGGVGQAATITGNGIDVYYDPGLPENAYLGGLSYALVGGGEIQPILPACEDGWDNDGDGLADFPADPGCQKADSNVENPACDDGSDNDLDGFADWDGAGVGDPDPECVATPWRGHEGPGSGCGLGPELAALLPGLAALRRRRRAGR